MQAHRLRRGGQPDNLPTGFRIKLRDVADRGLPYNESDVLSSGAPSKRLLIGAATDDLVLPAVEVGGMVYSRPLNSDVKQNGEWQRGPDVLLTRVGYDSIVTLLDEARRLFECEGEGKGS